MTNKKIMNIIIAFLPLLFGGLIYVFFRDENIIFLSWLKIINIDSILLNQFVYDENIISSFIIYSCPNGLWILSGLLMLKIIWRYNKIILLIYSIIFIVLGISFEIGQYFNILLGTFDILDIISILFFSTIGLVINNNGVKCEKV
jgi:hypothetical protein